MRICAGELHCIREQEFGFGAAQGLNVRQALSPAPFTTILRIRTNAFNSLRLPWAETGFPSAIPECGKSGLGCDRTAAAESFSGAAVVNGGPDGSFSIEYLF